MTISEHITNEGENTLLNFFDDVLPKSNQIDALVGYFFFSGFREIAETIKDKKLRVLVGLELDRELLKKLPREKLDDLETDFPTRSIMDPVRESRATAEYAEDIAAITNISDQFDSSEYEKAFDIFLQMLKNGNLEIRKSKKTNHAKDYVVHLDENNVIQGMVITGSSNFSYNGFKGQGESSYPIFEKHHYERYAKRFEELWSDENSIPLVDIELADEFIKAVKEKVWLYAKPEPYIMYMRVLKEYFELEERDETIKSPKAITSGDYHDLKYQLDAIEMGIDRINNFGGVIIADVVGLGKSIIAAAIANNLEMRTIIIAPPHLKEQWNDYLLEFKLQAEVFSTGAIERATRRYENYDKGELLIILDEAHKHRNEDTGNYKHLHRLCQGNRVMALSATPFNNDPKDIFALIKLFDTPGQSTLQTVDNLSMEFRELISEYKKVRNKLKKATKDESSKKAEEIANRLRHMIEPVVIRRSRLDLVQIAEYRDDLKAQGVEFAPVHDPELLEYELGELTDLYARTLEKIWTKPEFENQSREEIARKTKTFLACRYNPIDYLSENSTYFERIAEESEGETSIADAKYEIVSAQRNIAKFMRTLLVRRFESSVAAFRASLEKMISAYEEVLGYIENQGFFPIYKRGNLPSFLELEDMGEEEIDDFIEEYSNKKDGLKQIKRNELDVERFILDLNADLNLLKTIHDDWDKNASDKDPKFDEFYKTIKIALKEQPERKIVVFSEYAVTVDYITERLREDGFDRVFKYTSKDSSDENKRIIKANFDAGIPTRDQVNDFDVIIATDAISEGFNLHRAGIVMNYDIPYNPTRVIQRVGRINRINRKVFDELFIYNFFPSPTGEKETGTKAISTLKMNMIHALMGEDTKTLTSDEELRNYFADQYKKEDAEFEQLSWDVRHKNAWNIFKNASEIIEAIEKIPHRSRIARKTKQEKSVISFGKRGKNAVFAIDDNKGSRLIDPELALGLFEATPEEQAFETSSNFHDQYEQVKDSLFRKHIAPSMERGRSRRQAAVAVLRALETAFPTSKAYLKEVRQIIIELDALPEGLLKDITNINLKNLDEAIAELNILVSSDYIDDIFETAKRSTGQEEFLVLTEEFLSE